MSRQETSVGRLMGFPKLDRRWLWIGAGLITLIINYLFKLNPNFTEIVYSRGIFVLIRNVWDYTLGWLPFPILYLILPILIVWVSRKLIITLRNYQQVRWRYRLGSMLISLLALISGIFTLFQFLWGFNYHRVPVEVQLGLTLRSPDSAAIYSEAQLATGWVIESRAQIPNIDSDPLSPTHLPDNLELHMRSQLVKALRDWKYPTPGRVRGRRLHPEGLLMRLGATGIYIPFVGEGHIDSALPPVVRPFTLAHELSHGLGIGDEGSANFWAFLATEQSTDPAIKYSGRLAYWRYTMRQLRLLDRGAFERIYDNLPEGIIADLNEIRNVYSKYPDFFPEMNRRVYDSYLKSQGVEKGILSYNELVARVRAWRMKRSLEPI